MLIAEETVFSKRFNPSTRTGSCQPSCCSGASGWGVDCAGTMLHTARKFLEPGTKSRPALCRRYQRAGTRVISGALGRKGHVFGCR
jgi:hypothetical protein